MSNNYSSQFWVPQVNPPVNGEPVDSSVVSRSLTQLAQRDSYLFGQLQNLSQNAGQLVASQAPLEIGVSTGQIVYWNDNIQKFAPAFAGIAFDEAGELKNLESSFATGLVLSASGGVGNVLLYGTIDPSTSLPGTTMEYLLDYVSETGSFTPGVYYLSRKIPGKVTQSPNMPRVQLGYFSNSLIVFSPRYDGYPSGHVHYTFNLEARPAASQNYARTGFADVTPQGEDPYKVVDYYNTGSETSLPDIAIAIRKNGSPSAGHDQRVEIYSALDGNLGIDVITRDLDYNDPFSGSDISSSVANWPDWGVYVSVPGTNLDIAFFRHDGVYGTNTPKQDWPDDTGAKYKIYLPNDLSGWANSNPYEIDLLHPLANPYKYRYVIESNTRLASAWPPAPLNSCRIEYINFDLNSKAAVLPTLKSLYWDPITSGSIPWPDSYTVETQSQFDNNPPQTLYFIPASPENYSQLVTSLVSRSSGILIQRCPDGASASTGDLQVVLDLSLGVNPTIQSGYDTAFVSVSGETFSASPIVSEIVAGDGISITRIDGGSPNALLPGNNSGKLLVSRRDIGLEDEFSSIALRNAKEVFKDNISYVSFIQPSKSPSAISARFKVPQIGFNPNKTSLQVTGLYLGSSSISQSGGGAPVSYNAVLKAVYQIIRPGINLDSLNEVNSVAVQYWVIPFGTQYSKFKLLDTPYPISNNGANYKIEHAYGNVASTFNRDSLILTLDNPGFYDNDVVSVNISREASVPGTSIVDNYPGELGLVSLRWKMAVNQ